MALEPEGVHVQGRGYVEDVRIVLAGFQVRKRQFAPGNEYSKWKISSNVNLGQSNRQAYFNYFNLHKICASGVNGVHQVEFFHACFLSACEVDC